MGEGSVAIIGGQGLGDNLIEMILAENASRAGFQATMFCTRMCQLEHWFPKHRFLSTPDVESCEQLFTGYQYILWPQAAWSSVNREVAAHWIAYERMYRHGVTRAENMAHISRKVFNVDAPTRENGIKAPDGLRYRRYARRVCIHPTSAELSKNWLPERFLALGLRLQARGFQVVFIMSLAEVEAWKGVVGKRFPLHGFETVDACAAFVYESGYFIGNDSGGGHLASCLNIPTLSIHGRKGKARLWRPAWGQVEVVTPVMNVIGGSLRQYLWKYFLSIAAVERGFIRLLKRTTT